MKCQGYLYQTTRTAQALLDFELVENGGNLYFKMSSFFNVISFCLSELDFLYKEEQSNKNI